MGKVRISKRHLVMENYSQDPCNPHPAFPHWSPWDIYPYQFWGTMRKFAVPQKYYMPTIENDFLRVTVAADIGGRIWDVYDKIGKRHLANFNTGVRSYNAGFGLNYTTGGIECNYPYAHSVTTSRPREVSTARHEDGSASIIISEFEHIWRTRWSVAYTLYPDRSFIELRVRIYNRTPHDSRYLYWNNCGFVLNNESQFILPEDAGAMHGEEAKTFSWPLWRHRDLSFWRNVPPEMLGLYMLDAEEPYFGYYDHGNQFGLVHYGDLADLPGKKYWTWGTHPEMIKGHRKTHHSMNEVYGEIQSGRIVIQEHLDRVPPETECEWSEIWYPVRGTGAFNGAGQGAAMRAEIVETSAGHTRIKITAMGNGFFPKAKLMLSADRIDPIIQPMSLTPKASAERILTLKGKAGPEQHTTCILHDETRGILATCRLRHPNKRDSWREVKDYDKPLKPVGTEQMFIAAEAQARDWGNHDLQAPYEKAIQQDEAFSPARKELGKLATWRGQHDKAIEHFEIARKRDEDSLDLRYFHGVALMFAGRTAEARKCFELSNRYDCEARSLVRLAELRMRDKNWHHALRHLDRLKSAYPKLTRPRCLRAACLRKLGQRANAISEITAALDADTQDPFLQLEKMFIKAEKADAKKLPAPALKSLIEQVRGHEPPLLEAAFDYLSAGLLQEAETVLKIIPKAGPLTAFTLAYVTSQLGQQPKAIKLLQRACKADIVGHQPSRLEMFPILEWARERLPKNPRPLLLLGNLMAGKRRLQEALTLWRKAEKLRERHYLLHSNLGFHQSRVAKNTARALAHFRQAAKENPKDLYVIHEIFAGLASQGKRTEAIAFLEKRNQAVLSSPRLAHDLLSAYLEQNNYKKFDSLCAQCNFSINWQIPGPHSLWWKRHFQEALKLVKKGNLRKALELLEGMKPVPAHLGIMSSQGFEEDRCLYHQGCIHEKLGNIKTAQNCWEKALAVDHYTGYEPAYWYGQWNQRYFQALALIKLGRKNEANALFDAMELLAGNPELPLAARQNVINLVERGRFAPDGEKDPISAAKVTVATRAEA